MASPQVEDGYTRIANELMAALSKAQLSGPEFMISLAVISRTYGWNKKDDQISLRQFQQITGMTRTRIIRAIKHLVRYSVLGSITGDTRSSSTYWIIKDYDKWTIDPGTLKRTTPTPGTPDDTTPGTLGYSISKIERQLKDSSIDPKPHKVRFEPPSLQAVLLYLKERNSPVDGEAFHAYYSANGWMQGRNKPIKNWKAAIVTWEKNEKKFNSNNKQENKWGI